MGEGKWLTAIFAFQLDNTNRKERWKQKKKKRIIYMTNVIQEASSTPCNSHVRECALEDICR